MSVATKVGKRVIGLANYIINTGILIVILLLLVLGCYALWDSRQVFASAGPEVYEKYKPTAENGGLSFAELQAINPDVCAWLTVYGTNIDYPVVQGKYNFEYINKNAEGKYSLAGSIYLEAKCSRDFSDFSSILHGHHMDKGVMFGDIEFFADEEYFNARRYGTLYAAGREQGLEFFIFAHVSAYNRAIYRNCITDPEDKQDYLDLLYEAAMHTRTDVSVTVDDRIVLLSTCSGVSTNGRDVLIGKIIDEVPKDPFATERPDRPELPTVDALTNFWINAPLWAKIGMATAPFLLILLLAILTIKKRKRKRAAKKQETTLNKGDG